MAAALAGVIIGGPTLRLRSDYLAIVTLGFGEIVRFTARNLEITGGASGLSHIPEPSLFGWHIDSSIDFYYVFVVLAVLAYIASQRLFDSVWAGHGSTCATTRMPPRRWGSTGWRPNWRPM